VADESAVDEDRFPACEQEQVGVRERLGRQVTHAGRCSSAVIGGGHH
jgi:hypothetical protein